MPQLTGMQIDISLNSVDITVSKITLTITDNSTSAKSRGVPDGRLRGSVEGNGSIELDTYNFNLLIEEAQKAGSFRDLEPFDVLWYADANTIEMKVEAFGIVLKLSDILDIDANGEDGLIHKIDYDVTGRDFVKINDVPYLRSIEIEHIPSS